MNSKYPDLPDLLRWRKLKNERLREQAHELISDLLEYGGEVIRLYNMGAKEEAERIAQEAVGYSRQMREVLDYEKRREI